MRGILILATLVLVLFLADSEAFARSRLGRAAYAANQTKDSDLKTAFVVVVAVGLVLRVVFGIASLFVRAARSLAGNPYRNEDRDPTPGNAYFHEEEPLSLDDAPARQPECDREWNNFVREVRREQLIR